jgi:hypothetical protein
MASAHPDQQGYVPGVCNIGPDERRMRRGAGVFGTMATVVLLAVLLATNAAKPWRLLLFFPVAGAASGFLQDRLHFCAGYGLRGVANVFNQAGETEDITTAEFRRQDQRRALQIAGMSALVGALIAVGAALV